MFSGKPIIGISGGIGSGKSFVARLFGELGCLVIDSDEQVRRAYEVPEVREQLRRWWGESVFHPDGTINRRAIAARVFSDPSERARLEGLLHPLVARMRDAEMAAHASDPQTVAFVWDTPLLFEAGVYGQCDALVFVDTPQEERIRRVRDSRGWDAAELARRENLQWPLDRKREISDHHITNTAGADEVRHQVRNVLSRILARSPERKGL
jgi:dephospho-CoA kinase